MGETHQSCRQSFEAIDGVVCSALQPFRFCYFPSPELIRYITFLILSLFWQQEYSFVPLRHSAFNHYNFLGPRDYFTYNSTINLYQSSTSNIYHQRICRALLIYRATMVSRSSVCDRHGMFALDVTLPRFSSCAQHIIGTEMRNAINRRKLFSRLKSTMAVNLCTLEIRKKRMLVYKNAPIVSTYHTIAYRWPRH